jgi:hypothetical protein
MTDHFWADVDPAHQSSVRDCSHAVGFSLHHVATRGDVAELTRLLGVEYDIEGFDDKHETTLQCVIITDKLEAVQLLLSRGAGASLFGQYGSCEFRRGDAVLCAVRFDRLNFMKAIARFRYT